VTAPREIVPREVAPREEVPRVISPREAPRELIPKEEQREAQKEEQKEPRVKEALREGAKEIPSLLITVPDLLLITPHDQPLMPAKANTIREAVKATFLLTTVVPARLLLLAKEAARTRRILHKPRARHRTTVARARAREKIAREATKMTFPPTTALPDRPLLQAKAVTNVRKTLRKPRALHPTIVLINWASLARVARMIAAPDLAMELAARVQRESEEF